MSKKLKNKKGRSNENSTPNKSGKHEKYNLDDEIVIGLNVKMPAKEVVKKKPVEEKVKVNTRTSKIIKTLSIFFLVVIAILLFFMSPVFNIESITVNGNTKLTTGECIELSGLEIGQNIYKMNKRQIKNNIRKNAYIENVYISRKLPSKIEITIEERKPTYKLQLENGEYSYINNQGYILEKNYINQDLIGITGFSTKIENINLGNRLCETDLRKLETVLKIVDSAQNNGVIQYITSIDIENKNDYKLVLESEKKVVYLGDASSLSTRILYLKEILNKEQGIEGEIFINGNLNTDKVYFREKV